MTGNFPASSFHARRSDQKNVVWHLILWRLTIDTNKILKLFHEIMNETFFLFETQNGRHVAYNLLAVTCTLILAGVLLHINTLAFSKAEI